MKTSVLEKFSDLKLNMISSIGIDENLQDGLCWFQKIQDIIKQSVKKSVCERLQNSSQ